jgi:exonuclease SbcC
MKILQIRFKNINSLKGEHFIDFEAEPLKSNALFAITGPTGSGKSTLLDVICLALFNQIPRMNKVSKSELSKTGAVITRHQKEAFAEVVYHSAAGKFSSHWDIQYNRNHNLNDYEMQIKDLISGEELDLKKSEVPAKNEALIGLNYKQFIKSILLAQGEFAKFLQAKDSDRKQILEQITGTDIYRKLGMLAWQKAKQVTDEIKLNQQRKTDLEDKIWEEDFYQYQFAVLKKHQTEKEKLSKDLVSLQKQKEFIDQRSHLQLKLKKHKEELSEVNTLLENFKTENGNKIQLHEQTQTFADELQTWKSLQENQLQINQKIKALEVEIDEIKQKQKETFAKAKKLTRSDFSSNHLEENLESFRTKVTTLANELKEVRNTYSLIREPLKQNLVDANISCNLSELKKAEDKVFKYEIDAKNELHSIQTELNQKTASLVNLTESELNLQIETAFEAKQVHQHLDKSKKEKSQLSERIKVLKEEIKPFPDQIEKYKNDLKLKELQLENLELQKTQELLKASLDEHRANLKDGEACPLCGALEHPFKLNDRKKQDEISLQLKQQEKEVAELKEKLLELTNKLSRFENEQSNLEKQIDKYELEISEFNDILNEKFKLINQQKGSSTWSVFIENLKEIKSQKERKHKLEEKAKLIKAITTGISKLLEVESKGINLKKELDSLYIGNSINEDVNSLKSKWNKLVENLRVQQNNLDSEREKNQILYEKFALLDKKLSAKVKEQNFESIKDAAMARMKEHEFQSLQNRLNELKQIHQKANIDVKYTQQSIEEVEQKINIKDATLLLPEIELLKEQLSEIEKQILELSRTIENQKEYKQEINKLTETIENTRNKNKNWLLIDELIGDKTGKKFNDFAQDLSLQHLLSMANKRLVKLNDRYRLDKPSVKEGDDLVAIDFHMGNERRSVRTLSGGETFVVSLALALALSDLASKNVKINSLFIDEGFGTLDPETLDQTLDTLERLQAESNKTIGIISHVEALKERIQTQIKLNKNGQGYSSLEVI